MREAIYHFDQYITRIIALWPEGWRTGLIAITSLGDPIVTVGIGIVVAGVGLLQYNPRLILSGATIWFTLMTGSLLKVLVGRARPATEYATQLTIPTLSFPSGHSSGSVVAYGLLAYLCWHLLPSPWGWIATILFSVLIVSIGVSRIYLGAHYPSDVLFGWLLGLAALSIIIVVIRPLQ